MLFVVLTPRLNCRYAMTVHKVQGSTIHGNVIVDIVNAFAPGERTRREFPTLPVRSGPELVPSLAVVRAVQECCMWL